jgi:hypothetical protein
MCDGREKARRINYSVISREEERSSEHTVGHGLSGTRLRNRGFANPGRAVHPEQAMMTFLTRTGHPGPYIVDMLITSSGETTVLRSTGIRVVSGVWGTVSEQDVQAWN